MPAPPAPTSASAAPELRRHLLRMVIGVGLIHAMFIALDWRLAVDTWPQQRRLLFVVVWTAATLAVVLTSLARIRTTRIRIRRERMRAP